MELQVSKLDVSIYNNQHIKQHVGLYQEIGCDTE